MPFLHVFPFFLFYSFGGNGFPKDDVWCLHWELEESICTIGYGRVETNATSRFFTEPRVQRVLGFSMMFNLLPLVMHKAPGRTDPKLAKKITPGSVCK